LPVLAFGIFGLQCVRLKEFDAFRAVLGVRDKTLLKFYRYFSLRVFFFFFFLKDEDASLYRIKGTTL
jgi:hypothetical protein